MSTMPHLSGAWLRALLGAELPEQPRSTCARCAMVPGPQGEPPVTSYPFDPRVKCCGYTPHLPNYLVGAAIREEDPAADVLRERIRGRVGASPLGVGRSPAYDLVYEHATNVLGRSLSLRCPYYLEESGSCGVHPHRNGLCAAWFCKPERGQVGAALWEAVRELLGQLELELSRWAALQEGAPLRSVLDAPVRAGEGRRVSPSGPDVDGWESDLSWRGRWGALAGDEEGYFLRCAARVEALSWEEVLAIGGPLVEARRLLLLEAWAAWGARTLPERLAVGRHQTIAMGPLATLAVTWSALDPVEIPTLVGSVLHYFSGAPLAETLALIEEERGLQLEEELLQQLVDQGLLVGV
ncbi:MAG: hypothetical protein JXX28_06510 [Deltaproteobacteria bacterium]|nr:hypothetical protein [Deltaproteobacteria bacterium]